MSEKLSLKEQKILWTVLNQAQGIGLNGVANLLIKTEWLSPPKRTMLDDWIRQTKEEYDIINSLKAKLCGDV